MAQLRFAFLGCVLCGSVALAEGEAAAPAGPSTNAQPIPNPPSKTLGAQPAPSAQAEAPAPFAFADFTWAPANGRTTDNPLSLGDIFTGEFRVDVAFHHSFAEPIDDTISGSSEVFRHNEFQLVQLGVGGDLHYKNVIGRLMTQFGMYSETTPRNDASPGRGQWNLADAMRYISEAYGGYHIDWRSGINIEAGIFMSYIGLWSYYNADNWTYQPSFVSSNTPWFFQGMRIQFFPSDKLKLEPWLVNGWQSYGTFNNALGVGLQVLWRPTGWFSILGNQYVGTDTLGVPDRKRIHTDDSVMVKYYDNPNGLLAPWFIDKAAASLTIDAGCEWGGDSTAGTRTSCSSGTQTSPDQYFLGFMAYTRFWFDHDLFALTGGGGAIDNPGRYLVLLPPINGATAFSGTPFFTENPGNKFYAWDMTYTFDFMPSQYITFRAEYVHRWASVPYWSGHGGVTPPGGNQGPIGGTTLANGQPVVTNASGQPVTNPDGTFWAPDLVQTEDRITFAILLKM
jgi:hypothetical protein